MNSFGRLFRVSIFGESHGNGAGIVIDGCPPGIPFTEDDMKADLARRKSGRVGTTPRTEADEPHIFSGTFNGHTTGAPVTIFFHNTNTRSRDYSQFVSSPRPGHADFVARHKFKGFTDYRGGGHFSGRVSLGLVAAGALAKKVASPMVVGSEILEIGGQKDYEALIVKAVDEHDSLGGIVQLTVDRVPIGLGEPFFDSAEALLSHMVFAVPATRGIEFGTGFAAARMRGSEHNDWIKTESGETETNHAGGINGGITNGNQIVFRVAIKPTSSVATPQDTFNFDEKKVKTMVVEGRHDACITLRVQPVLEAGAAIVMADMLLTARMWQETKQTPTE
ncbi:MAG: chorismate synthase [Lentisphaeria bacterium]|nr:chorismate synthase [Lentisphaeria bacterium]